MIEWLPRYVDARYFPLLPDRKYSRLKAQGKSEAFRSASIALNRLAMHLRRKGRFVPWAFERSLVRPFPFSYLFAVLHHAFSYDLFVRLMLSGNLKAVGSLFERFECC